MIWTTTPWTLPANQAIAIGEGIKYSLVKFNNSLLVIARNLIENVFKKTKNDKFNILGECLGKDLINLKAEHPFYNKQVPIVSASHVTTDNGTGLVHIAPGHGQEDYISGIENNLEIFNPVDDKGKFIDSLEIFGGLSVRDADEKIIEVLKDKTIKPFDKEKWKLEENIIKFGWSKYEFSNGVIIQNGKKLKIKTMTLT